SAPPRRPCPRRRRGGSFGGARGSRHRDASRLPLDDEVAEAVDVADVAARDEHGRIRLLHDGRADDAIALPEARPAVDARLRGPAVEPEAARPDGRAPGPPRALRARPARAG